ncbi:MAG TPA: hypothetical protein VL122_00675 [Nitrospirota bacterium]|nr:hypothetical protein [Nitrospirota bacterium]
MRAKAKGAASFRGQAVAYAEARARQDLQVIAVFAGECVGLIHDRLPWANIVESRVALARALVQRSATLDFA